MSEYKHIDTALIHAGIYGDERTGAVNTPIYLTSTYKQDGLGRTRAGYEYSRTGNPTREALEALIAELEGGTQGFAFASGMAAEAAILSLFSAGDRILISSNVYGGTYRILNNIFAQFGLLFSIAQNNGAEGFEAIWTDDVKAVLIENPTNPLLDVTDIAAVARVAHEHGALLIVDNTILTPYLQRPIESGADIVVHSATKYLGGHSDIIGGLAVTATGATLADGTGVMERLAFIQNATGGILQPFDSFLLIRSIKTLGLRMERHVANAKQITEYLRGHSGISKVYYPEIGAMISFELDEGHDPTTFFSALKLIDLAESLGGVESLVCHPATMTHASIPEDIRKKVGITDGLIRLSVGIEHVKDLTLDLGQAIQSSERK
jgi:cystathionine beta-lyase